MPKGIGYGSSPMKKGKGGGMSMKAPPFGKDMPTGKTKKKKTKKKKKGK